MPVQLLTSASDMPSSLPRKSGRYAMVWPNDSPWRMVVPTNSPLTTRQSLTTRPSRGGRRRGLGRFRRRGGRLDRAAPLAPPVASGPTLLHGPEDGRWWRATRRQPSSDVAGRAGRSDQDRLRPVAQRLRLLAGLRLRRAEAADR